jgi:transcriptional regulator with XRE-family HTH domain
MAPTQVSRYEAGRAVPRRVTLARIAEALAIRYQWLTAGEGAMDEYSAQAQKPAMTFEISGEVAERLHNYASASGLSVEQAMTQILDQALSVYTTEETEVFRKSSQEFGVQPASMNARLASIAGQVKIIKS